MRERLRIFYPTIRVDVPWRPYVEGEEDPKKDGDETKKNKNRSGDGGRRGRPAVLGKPLPRWHFGGGWGEAEEEGAARGRARPPPSRPEDPLHTPGRGKDATEACLDSLPPPPSRTLSNVPSAVPPLVIECIGLQSADIDPRRAYHPSEHEEGGDGKKKKQKKNMVKSQTKGRDADAPDGLARGDSAAPKPPHLLKTDALEDMNWLPAYHAHTAATAARAGMPAPHTPRDWLSTPLGHPLPPAPFHRGVLGETTLSVRPFLSSEFHFLLGESITLPLLATTPQTVEAQKGSGVESGGGVPTPTTTTVPHALGTPPPLLSSAPTTVVGEVGTITFRLLTSAFDGDGEYPAGVRLPRMASSGGGDGFSPPGRDRHRVPSPSSLAADSLVSTGGKGVLSSSSSSSPTIAAAHAKMMEASTRKNMEAIRFYERRILSRLHAVGSPQLLLFHYLFYEGHIATGEWPESLRLWLDSIPLPSPGV